MLVSEDVVMVIQYIFHGWFEQE